MKAGERAARALLKRSRDLAGVEIKATIPAIIIPPGFTPPIAGRGGGTRALRRDNMEISGISPRQPANNACRIHCARVRPTSSPFMCFFYFTVSRARARAPIAAFRAKTRAKFLLINTSLGSDGRIAGRIDVPTTDRFPDRDFEVLFYSVFFSFFIFY